MGRSQRISASTAILVDKTISPLITNHGILVEGRAQFITLQPPRGIVNHNQHLRVSPHQHLRVSPLHRPSPAIAKGEPCKLQCRPRHPWGGLQPPRSLGMQRHHRPKADEQEGVFFLAFHDSQIWVVRRLASGQLSKALQERVHLR